MILRAAALILALGTGVAGAEEKASLADLRAELQHLTHELQSLRSELVASGAEGFKSAGGDTAIDRMNAMERQISQLTGKTEQLQNRIRRIVDDGTRRINDIEFRLCEMDETCDLGALMTTPGLGSMGSGAVSQPVTGSPEIKPAEGKEPSTAEQQDFDRAREVLGQGDFQRAAQLFAEIAETHAGGPLTAEALFLRGTALHSASQPEQASAAWLEAFASDPNGARAGDSLLGLASLANDGGDAVMACLYLSEIPVRFAGSKAATEAENRMKTLACSADEQPAGDAEAAADLVLDE